MRAASPLRYPGGKWRIAPFFRRLLSTNDLGGCEYVEPYAGGGSLALSLLYSGAVSRVHLNDLAPEVYWFWWAALTRSGDLCDFISNVPLTIDEWQAQREIYREGVEAGRELRFAKAVFYLNRTNHSGIMNGGVIGGLAQRGRWRLDARFNRPELVRRVARIADHESQIRIYNRDALEFLGSEAFPAGSLVYLDPPYFKAGAALYLNAYTTEDHEAVGERVGSMSGPWLVSYDDVAESRMLYRGCPRRRLSLLHTARTTHLGREVIFFSGDLRIPRMPFATPRVKQR